MITERIDEIKREIEYYQLDNSDIELVSVYKDELQWLEQLKEVVDNHKYYFITNTAIGHTLKVKDNDYPELVDELLGGTNEPNSKKDD